MKLFSKKKGGMPIISMGGVNKSIHIYTKDIDNAQTTTLPSKQQNNFENNIKKRLMLLWQQQDKKYETEKKGKKIPLKLFQTWHTKHLPPKMKNCIETLKNQNPEFEHYLFDDNDCRNYIIQHFPEEVLVAYDTLIPGAYKSDLWRYCVLLKEGGVYLDIKFHGLNGFKLIDYIEKDIEKDYFVFDLPIHNYPNLLGIYNAFMMSHPNNPLFYDCIKQIIENVKNKYYGMNSLEPTGPLLLGKIYEIRNKNIKNDFHKYFDFKLMKDKYIFIKNKDNIKILIEYSEYREEQKKTQITKHYGNLWNEKNIYY